MARNCYVLRLGENEYKLRLTLKGQKKLKEHNPDVAVIATIIGAVEDPDDMDILLTTALNWEGNKNKIHTGEELYDEMVDNGYSGSEKFMEVVLGIAKNAGLLTEDDRVKMERATKRLIRSSMDGILDESEDEEGEESPENPPAEFRTLDG